MKRRNLIKNFTSCTGLAFFDIFFKKEKRILDIDSLKRILQYNSINVLPDVKEKEFLEEDNKVLNECTDLMIDDPYEPELSILETCLSFGTREFRFYKLDQISTVNGGYGIIQPPRDIINTIVEGKDVKLYQYDVLVCWLNTNWE